MNIRSSHASLALGLAAALVVAAPAAADWLVMKDGSGRIETKGAYQVKGAMVVFTRPNGTLSSVRATDIDLDASKKATEDAAKPPAAAASPAPTAPQKPVVTITDSDVAHVDPAAVAAEQAAAKPGADAAKPAAPPTVKAPSRLDVSSWRQDLDASKDGVVIVGEVNNSSRDVVGNIVVTASLYDEKGKLLATAEGLLGANTLQPSQHTSFRATFPGVFNFADAKFETKGLALQTSGQS